MQIEMNFADMNTSAELELHIEEMVDRAVAHVEDRITRVEVHLHDDNANKHGAMDKRCVMEARPAGRQPIVVQDKGDNLYDVVRGASDKLQRALESRLKREPMHPDE